MEEKFLWGEELENYLNDNIGRIKRFELIDSFYLRIHMNDGSYVEVSPEYGGIYFQLKSESQGN